MESVIKWRTGEPKEGGWYCVSVKTRYSNLHVDVDYRNISISNDDDDDYWDAYKDDDVIAWCPLSEIQPYKE